MKFIEWAIEKPKLVMIITLIMTLIFLAFIPFITIDTDPENMLSENEKVRVMHNELTDRYDMYDIVVLGIINDVHPQGVFNRESLSKVYEISKYIDQIELPNDGDTSDNEELDRIITRDIMGPTSVDHVESIGMGTLKFDWVMSEAPSSDADALVVKEKLLSNPMFKNTIVSEDGKALCLYVPISSKDISYDVSKILKEKIESYKGDEDFYITGLPVAEDTFGIEMFIQMAITAPLAMLCIFFLMFYFFKKLRLIYSPMLVAMVSVFCTMGLLIGMGFTVHIMSSMIPIFVMPIAVLDSVHILSEFFDRYPSIRDRKQTLLIVVKELFRPMLFTSLTSAAGFASLALTPIPPVQVFGVFVAFGILLAWLLTIIFIPAYIMLMSEESLQNFGNQSDSEGSIMSKFLHKMRSWTTAYPRAIVIFSLLLLAFSIYGISLIQINDNPVNWFSKNHEIRVADRELNRHFGGSYMAYLNIEQSNSAKSASVNAFSILSKLENSLSENEGLSHMPEVKRIIEESIGDESTFYKTAVESLYEKADNSESDDEAIIWEDLASLIELEELGSQQIFKNPEVLEFIEQLENHLVSDAVVGKVNSLNKLVKKINQELHDGDDNYYKIPQSLSAVGQCILSYQNSHNPEQLRHLVDTEYKGLNLWIQLKSGDNKDMESTMESVEEFFSNNKAPINLVYNWYGLTYINVIWQQKMVAGMVKAFLGSFIVVFIMMTLLFRSIKWALLCMLPLTVTIALIYGMIGLIGKDYDMPVAVLSSLALGLAIDFSIHFLVRSRQHLREGGSWDNVSLSMFGEPSRAITRNIIVIAIGFLPLIFSNLIPYKTVGILLASILTLSGIVTLMLLPALIKIFERYLHKN